MSNRVEWALAESVTIKLVPRGTEFHGYEEPVTAEYGLYLDLGGAGVVIEGSAFELGELCGRITRMIFERQIDNAPGD